MPAFSHCFLKRFMAFSNDSPSLTRTPGILRITTFRPAKGLACARGDPRENAAVYSHACGCQTYLSPQRRAFTGAGPPNTVSRGTWHERSAFVGGAARVRDGARRQPAHRAARGG